MVQGGRGAWPRPEGDAPTDRGARGQCDAVRTGERRALMCGPWAAARERGREEARGRVGWPGRKKRSGLSPDEQDIFWIYSIMF
jgi:hypothetical protein